MITAIVHLNIECFPELENGKISGDMIRELNKNILLGNITGETHECLKKKINEFVETISESMIRLF